MEWPESTSRHHFDWFLERWSSRFNISGQFWCAHSMSALDKIEKIKRWKEIYFVKPLEGRKSRGKRVKIADEAIYKRQDKWSEEWKLKCEEFNSVIDKILPSQSLEREDSWR